MADLRSRMRNFEVVQLLFAQGDVEVDSKDQSGRSSLSYAADGGNSKIVQLLLAREDVEADSKAYSAERANFEIVQLSGLERSLPALVCC